MDRWKKFEIISYQFMENYDLNIKYHSFDGEINKNKKINLREIINLFIAEGLYKYQVIFIILHFIYDNYTKLFNLLMDLFSF